MWPERPKVRRGVWILAAVIASGLLVCGLPLMLEGVIVGASFAGEYDGTCPGIMDIPAYPCTPGEYLQRILFSPFALPAHVLVIGGSLVCSLPLVAGLWLGLAVFLRRR